MGNFGRLAKLTSGSVPSDVAVQQPDAGVVWLEGDGDVTAGGHEHHVPSGRVDEVEALVAVDWVEGGLVLGEDDYVHPVPVQRVGDCRVQRLAR